MKTVETVKDLVFELTGSSKYSEFGNQTERLSIIYTGLLSWMRKNIHTIRLPLSHLSSNLPNHAKYRHAFGCAYPVATRSQRKVDFLRYLSHFIVVANPSTLIITRLSIRLQNLSCWACALVPCW